jgi:hypothetical protein
MDDRRLLAFVALAFALAVVAFGFGFADLLTEAGPV